MKFHPSSLFATLLLLLILQSCNTKKLEINRQTYIIDVGFSLHAQAHTEHVNQLLVTENGTGEFLGLFEIPKGLTSFNGTLEVEGAPLMDYHLITVSNIDYPYIVYSHVAIENNSYVYFAPIDIRGTLSSNIALTIHGITSFDSVSTGFFRPTETVFNPQDQALELTIPTFRNQGIIFRLSANSESGFRYFYLPDTLAGKNISLDWDDMKIESNFTSIQMPGNPYVSDLEVNAVSPDFDKAITLFRSREWGPMPDINLPIEIPSDWKIAIRLYRFGLYCDLMFDRNESIQIIPPDIQVNITSYSGNKIETTSTGTIDMVELASVGGDFYWQISGSPSSIQQVSLPDLSPYLSDTVHQSSITSFAGFALQFEHYNYHDIKDGFPFRYPGLFNYARGNFYKVQ